MLQQFLSWQKEINHLQSGSGGSLQRKRRIVEGCGNDLKRTVDTRDVGIFLPRTIKSTQIFQRRLKEKGKQEYRASGSWNRQPESTWSK